MLTMENGVGEESIFTLALPFYYHPLIVAFVGRRWVSIKRG